MEMAGKDLLLAESRLQASALDRIFTSESRPAAPVLEPIQLDGKFFRCGSEKWFIKGLTYGPFAPDDSGIFLPGRAQVQSDLAQIRTLGANAVRLYHTPPCWLLDEAATVGLRVFVDVPWEKHRCFLEDYSSQLEAIQTVAAAAQLGDHPALFAISVANEIPKDIVRFYGERRIERFIHTLLDAARQVAPQCLLTYTNYPSTEFLRPESVDFFCFNVYLEDPQKLGAYLDRLQHLAGNAPLVLGEHGLDSHAHGPDQQARQIAAQIERGFAHGLAGSFVFSFTDDWFAGGTQIENWAFGVTDRHRREKPAASALRRAWSNVPFAVSDELPSVSVVVCSYNGAATLEGCLQSLVNLRYPDCELILVDDGSTDRTPEIARQFSEVRYIRQENRGLSAARNVGARHAHGEIVAYTDSDCVADPDWLLYLMHDMKRQGVDLIGGPNIPPEDDCAIARCVAVSPGGPSHVMLDDQLAEHVPGCNLACRRDKLLAIGGFDEQFRVAGDDVDICWRFIDAGWNIGYSSSAVVWHHRRTTIRQYLRQQAGYGRSEGMLHFKHPARFNAVGSSLWSGVIYGEGALGLPLLRPVIYHGRFGLELFPTIYRQNCVSVWAYFTLMEWHLLSLFVLSMAVLYPPLLAMSVIMWSMTLVAVLRCGWSASLPSSAPWWSRGLVCLMHLLQPVTRAWHRYVHRLRCRSVPRRFYEDDAGTQFCKPIDPIIFDHYWNSAHGRGRELLLERAVQAATEHRWPGDFHCHWEPWDLMLEGDNWHSIELRSATEELGQGERFTRVRARLRVTGTALVATFATTIWSALAVWQDILWAQWLAMVGCALLAGRLLWSRRACRRGAAALLTHAARHAGLEPVPVGEGVVKLVSPSNSDEDDGKIAPVRGH